MARTSSTRPRSSAAATSTRARAMRATCRSSRTRRMSSLGPLVPRSRGHRFLYSHITQAASARDPGGPLNI
eukprot:scaffold74285_cov72-Phaeocystis_antarctica.AAC.2